MEGSRDERRQLDSLDGRDERRLREFTQGKLTEILERMTEEFFAVDCEWRYTYLNQRALRRIQQAKGEDLTREDLLGKSVWEVFPEQVDSVFYEKYHEALREQETVEFEAYLPLIDAWAEVHAYPSTEGLSVYFRDITERKQAEERIREGEARFRAQYTSFPVPTFSWWRVQDDFELVDYNEAADKITRGGLAELLGTRASEWYADRPQVLRMLSRCFQERVTVQNEIAWQMRTTGERKHFAVTFVYAPPDLVINYAEDITERKRAEEALEESNTLLRSIVEGTPDPIFLKDARGRYLLANSAAGEVVGQSAEKLLGKDNVDLMPSEAAKRTMEFDRQVMENDESQTGEEHLTVQGVTRTYLFTKAPYRDRKGEVAGVIGIARDITERQQAEEELRRAKERFHSLVRHSSDIITVLAGDGIVRYESPAVERVLGYRPEELVGKHAFSFIHPDDQEQVSAAFYEVLCNPEANPSVAYRMLHANGSWRYLESITSNQLRDPSVEGVVVNSRDVTERKLLEENQQRFLANAAHQLKTPVTTIIGAAELLTTKQSLDAAKRRQLLGHIFSEGRRMQRLSDTLLRLAKLGWDRQEPNLTAVDLAAAGRQAAGRAMPLVESMGLMLRVDGDGAYVLVDSEWLQDVILLLLSNAAKYSSSGQKISLRVHGSTLAIEDEGGGISAVDLPYVFDRFYRGKSSVEGFGLGLSICRDLIEQMGGSITLSSRTGSGTRVEVQLPEADANA